MIKAVIFDMYETLITQYETPLYFSKELAEDLGMEVEAFRKVWFATDYERTVGKREFSEVLTEIAKAEGIYTKEKITYMLEKTKMQKKDCFLHLHKEILPMLSDLKKEGFKVALISNCYVEEAAVIRESVLFPYFDVAMLSCEVGVCKPEKEIFTMCMDALGVKESECLYVGDGGSRELEVTKTLGLHPVQAAWYLKKGAYGQMERKEDFENVESPSNILKIAQGLNVQTKKTI